MVKELPTTAKAVVIGGGIVGCSTAYHLAKLGWTDTVLLERKKLTSGTTFHAAGLVGQLRSSANITELLGYSVDLYNRLEEETGLATGWKMNGGLRLACNDARWEEVKRQATTAQSFGLDMQLLSPSEARDLWPIMSIEDVIGAAFLPTDGQANPSDITQALAKGARIAGASIFEDTSATDILIEDGKIKGIQTDKGFIECEIVVCCAGQWTREFAGRFGVNVPLVPVQHQYLITETIKDMPRNLPTLRDPDRLTYYKEEVGGLVMGGYEPNPVLWAEDGIPEDFHFSLLPSDFDHFEPMMELALGRVPALETAGIKELVNGPESFTPDGNFILGEAPELKNFFVGAGFNAFGIASGGGAGMVLAEWVAKGEPPYDLWAADIRRFGKPHFDDDWIKKRTVEAYGKHYTMAWPHEEHQTGRPFRTSPLYERLKAAGACFGEKLGWERPNWFADIEAGEIPTDSYSFGRQNWFNAVAREHKAAREAAVLIDQTSFAKFLLTGSDAAAALDWIASGNVLRPIGSVIYTQMLNDKGGIECDLTVTRLEENEFYIVTGTGFATHDYNWILRNVPPHMDCILSDITEERSVLSLMGPVSREILAQVTKDEISHEDYPFATGRVIDIAGHPVLALRLTYMGELGWELHMSASNAGAVYDALMSAGGPLGLKNAGYRVIESCRLEKGYRAWGADIGPDHTPVEAGLGWAVKMKSGRDFKGRAAIERQKAKGVRKMLTCFTVQDLDIVLLGRETIYRNGERVGWLSSGGYGHTIEKSIGYGYVRNPDGVDKEFVLSGNYELDVALKRVPCQVHLEPLYDPLMKKIKS